MPFQKNFANLPSILLTLVNLVLLRYLIYPHLNFTPSLKLTYSTNHFKSVSRFDVTSLDLLTWLPDFPLTFIFVYHSRPFHSPALRPTHVHSVWEWASINILVWLAFADTLNLLTHFIVSFLLMYIFSLYISFISLSCEAIIIINIININLFRSDNEKRRKSQLQYFFCNLRVPYRCLHCLVLERPKNAIGAL